MKWTKKSRDLCGQNHSVYENPLMTTHFITITASSFEDCL